MKKANLANKISRLKKTISYYPGALIALSGGVDSALLLKFTKKILKNKVIAVTILSPIHPPDELITARKIARSLKCRHLVIESREMKNPEFIKNTRNRCYICKLHLFKRLKEISEQYGYVVFEGSNKSDCAENRPGLKALIKLDIKSPFIQAGIIKEEIRAMAKKAKLLNWNKPANACLATRIPYGQTITLSRLQRINRIENYLKKMGITQVRVRDHHTIARIEIYPDEFEIILRDRKKVVKYIRKFGYKYVAFDLEGYISGKLD